MELVGIPVYVEFVMIYLRRILFCPAHVLSVLVQALEQEAEAYTRMKELWGRVVPALVGHGLAYSSRSVYVATELLEGSELGDGRISCETLKRGVSLFVFLP